MVMVRFNLPAILVAVVLALLVPASAGATTIDLAPTNGLWLATTSGEPCCTNILTAGSAWEAANPGWNSSLSYDASSWAPYSGADGCCGWYPSDGSTSGFYTREVFTLSGTINSATFSAYVDDDVQVWVNGALVLSDTNGACCNGTPVDIAQYLSDGQNLIAVKANNNQGGFVAGFSGSIDVTPAVPEPASVAVMGTGLALVGLMRRRKRRSGAAEPA